MSRFLISCLAPIACGVVLLSTMVHAQSPYPIRIGVYDSRAVFVAWFNSPNAISPMPGLMTRMKEAKERNDVKAVAECEREALLRQAMMHEQAFGTGSIRSIMVRMEKELSSILTDEHLAFAVSKWELHGMGENVELVDITEKLVSSLQPIEKIKNVAKEMEKHPPVEDAFLIQD